MSHPGPLDALRARLHAVMTQPVTSAVAWGNPRAMTVVLHSVQRDLGGDAGRPPTDDVLRSSLQAFVKTQQVANFTQLKYVCYGVTVPIGKDQWRLIDKQPLFDELLGLVTAHEVQTKQFRRCYQGLLTGYFGFDRYATVAGDSDSNWQRLRGYLHDRMVPMRKAAQARGTAPDWLQTLFEHKNLLTQDPCSRYAKGLSRGDTDELKKMCAGLGITGSSWVWQDALMAYVRAVCAFPDAKFANELSRLLDLIEGRSEIKLPSTLATQATAMAVIRYRASASQPEHAALRDTCIHWIGNPWINRTAWDAHVNHEPAREMVNGWLKRRLIKDFFELLAQDGSADLRRLHYWLKWEPHITDMWFVLGTNARDNHGAAFMELRKRMTGRARILTDNNHQNNAFVMRIGPLLVIEFGVIGNACYAFAAADFRTSLERNLFTIADLKQRALATRLSHQSYWEDRFDYELRRLLQTVPLSKGQLRTLDITQIDRKTPRDGYQISSQIGTASTLPPAKSLVEPVLVSTSEAQVPANQRSGRTLTEAEFDALCRMCEVRGIDWEDNRSKNGALWLLVPNRRKLRTAFMGVLDHYGFQYTEGKGFWLKSGD